LIWAVFGGLSLILGRNLGRIGYSEGRDNVWVVSL